MLKLIGMVVVVFVPALASADPQSTLSESADWGARSRLAVSLGLFTPTGELGLEYTHVVLPHLEVGAGAGIGFTGPQASITPRLRAGAGLFSMTFGAGISGGSYDEPELFSFCVTAGDHLCPDNRIKALALWANFEMGLQFTSRSGMAWRVYGGIGTAVAHGACSRGNCARIDDMNIPYLGISFGHTL
jgi:hypothetical protein